MGIVRAKIKAAKEMATRTRKARIDRNNASVLGSRRLSATSEDRTMAKVGDKVPSATLRMMGPEGPKAMTTEELFAPGKKVVAFALPGAFTPT
jgi:hypothetical protein